MQWRLANDKHHWVHKVRIESEKPAQFITSLSNGVRRKPMTFEQLDENGTMRGTYPYTHDRNNYSYDDIKAMRHNESYGNKRQRRA